MNRTTVTLLLAALCLTPACDWSEQLPGTQARQDMAPPPKSSEGEDEGACGGCLKWSARPPKGISSGWRPW